MEIIHLILGKANPERMNGVNKVVYQLASRQAATGRKVEVWGISHDMTHNYGERNFVTRLFQAKKNPFQVDQPLVKAILSRKHNTVFHLHGGWIPVYATISAILKKNHISFVITPHGAYNTIAMNRSKWVKKLYFQMFEKRLLERAEVIHAIGQSEVAGLSQIYPNDHSLLLPYGFDIPGVHGVKMSNPNDFIIGFVGRLDIHTKGLDLLIEAFAQFHRQVPDSKLWIVGDSDEKNMLAKMIQQAGLEEDVILWGSKFGKEKEALFQKMDVFVHPSRNEGMPAAVLEACSFEIPCIVSEATNVDHFILKHKAGLAIPNNHAASLSSALLKIYEMKRFGEIKEMGKNARSMIIHEFDWNHILDKMDILYDYAKNVHHDFEAALDIHQSY